jgi:general secretion pathway protein B
MSFILDALKKLEQKRQRGSVPDLMTVHVPVQREIKKRPVWPYLILGALILNAALFFVWLQPKKPLSPSLSVNRHASSEHSTANQKSQLQGPAILRTPEVKPAVEVQKQKLPASKEAGQISAPYQPAPVPPAVTAEKPAKEIRDTQPPKTALSVSSGKLPSKESSSTNKPEVADTNKSVSGNRLPELSQLPQSTQSEIPQLHIFGHIYSDDPGTRLININGDIYKEGDTVAKNLKVEEITETGVILNYNGTRFLIRAF